jgi:hypothetical protein
MAVGIGGAAPRALANVFAGMALVAPGALASAMPGGCTAFTAHAWTAAVAAVFLAGLATTPPAHGGQAHGDALASIEELQGAETTIRAAEIVCARHLAKDAPPGAEGLLWEPAFYKPCVALHVRLDAAQFGAKRLAGDGEVSDQDILRQAGLLPQPR